MNQLKVVLFGLNADPPHLGHKKLCQDALDYLGPNTLVIVMPSGQHPFEKSSHASSNDRLKLTKLLFEDMPHTVVDHYEVCKKNKSYTLESLVYLKSKYPQAQLYFLISVDAANQFFDWHQPQAILALASPIIAQRKSYSLDPGCKDRMLGLCKPVFLNNDPLDISSTSIRLALNLHRKSDYLLPSQIAYINHHDLYKKSDNFLM